MSAYKLAIVEKQQQTNQPATKKKKKKKGHPHSPQNKNNKQKQTLPGEYLKNRSLPPGAFSSTACTRKGTKFVYLNFFELLTQIRLEILPCAQDDSSTGNL